MHTTISESIATGTPATITDSAGNKGSNPHVLEPRATIPEINPLSECGVTDAQRRQRIAERLRTQDDPATIAGTTLAKTPGTELEPRTKQLIALLEENQTPYLAGVLQELADERNFAEDALQEKLVEAIRELETGTTTIFGALDSTQQTATEGTRRRDGEHTLVAAKAYLLIKALKHFDQSDFAAAQAALRTANLPIAQYPTWFAKALESRVAQKLKTNLSEAEKNHVRALQQQLYGQTAEQESPSDTLPVIQKEIENTIVELQKLARRFEIVAATVKNAVFFLITKPQRITEFMVVAGKGADRRLALPNPEWLQEISDELMQAHRDLEIATNAAQKRDALDRIGLRTARIKLLQKLQEKLASLDTQRVIKPAGRLLPGSAYYPKSILSTTGANQEKYNQQSQTFMQNALLRKQGKMNETKLEQELTELTQKAANLFSAGEDRVKLEDAKRTLSQLSALRQKIQEHTVEGEILINDMLNEQITQFFSRHDFLANATNNPRSMFWRIIR